MSTYGCSERHNVGHCDTGGSAQVPRGSTHILPSQAYLDALFRISHGAYSQSSLFDRHTRNVRWISNSTQKLRVDKEPIRSGGTDCKYSLGILPLDDDCLLANLKSARLTRLSEEIASTLAKSVRCRSARLSEGSLTEHPVPIPFPGVKVVIGLLQPPQGVLSDRKMRRRGELDVKRALDISFIHRDDSLRRAVSSILETNLASPSDCLGSICRKVEDHPAYPSH